MSISAQQHNAQRKRFTEQEDIILRRLVRQYGANDWNRIAQHMPQRNARQCRHRYTNYLNDNYKPSPWTESEDAIIISMFNEVGAKWVMIAKSLEGRTGNDVKNRWHKHIIKTFPLFNHSQTPRSSNANIPGSLPIPQSNSQTTWNSSCKNQIILNPTSSPPKIKEDLQPIQYSQISIQNQPQPTITVQRPILISPITQNLTSSNQVFSNIQTSANIPAPQIVGVVIAQPPQIQINTFNQPTIQTKSTYTFSQFTDQPISADQTSQYSEIPENSQLFESSKINQINLLNIPKINNPPICVGPKNTSTYLQSVLN